MAPGRGARQAHDGALLQLEEVSAGERHLVVVAAHGDRIHYQPITRPTA